MFMDTCSLPSIGVEPNAKGERRHTLADTRDNRKKPARWAVRSSPKLALALDREPVVYGLILILQTR
jgi:hypothetical protein